MAAKQSKSSGDKHYISKAENALLGFLSMGSDLLSDPVFMKAFIKKYGKQLSPGFKAIAHHYARQKAKLTDLKQ